MRGYSCYVLLIAGTWYAPTVTGDVPPPCGGFSLLNIDEDHAVLFGGYMGGQRWSSDVYYVDLKIWVSDSGGHDDVRPVTSLHVTRCISLTHIGMWILSMLNQSV